MVAHVRDCMTDGSAAVLDVSIAGVGAELDAQATAMQSDERTLSEIRTDAAAGQPSVQMPSGRSGHLSAVHVAGPGTPSASRLCPAATSVFWRFFQTSRSSSAS